MWTLAQQYWKQLAVICLLSLVYFYIVGLKSELSVITGQLKAAQAEKISDDLQKEALRSAILDQSDAVDKQRVDAVKKLQEFKTAQYTIIAKYERERVAVRDLNGSNECDAMREIIRSAL